MKKPILILIENQRLGLFIFDESHDDHYCWLNDSEINRYTSRNRIPITRAGAQKYAETCQQDEQIVLGIYSVEDSEHVGNIALKNINLIDRCAELSILIGTNRQKGIGYEASKLLCTHGFNALGLNRIYCGTHEENIGMQKLAIKLGMKEEGRSRQAFFKNGKFADIIHYGMLKEEFVNANCSVINGG